MPKRTGINSNYIRQCSLGKLKIKQKPKKIYYYHFSSGIYVFTFLFVLKVNSHSQNWLNLINFFFVFFPLLFLCIQIECKQFFHYIFWLFSEKYHSNVKKTLDFVLVQSETIKWLRVHGKRKKIERCVWYCLLSHRGYLYIFSKTTFSPSASKRKCNGNERTEKKLHGKKSNLRDNTFWMLLERRANSVAQRETFCSFFHRIQSQRNIFFLCSLFGGDYDRVRMWCYFYGYFLLAVRIFDFPHSWNFIAQRHVIPFW